MKNKLFNHRKQHHNEKGQGIVEYLILLFLIGIAVVAILQVLEPQIANVFSDGLAIDQVY